MTKEPLYLIAPEKLPHRQRQFMARLEQLMTSAEITAAELARELTEKNPELGVVQRQRISYYLNGRNLPMPEALGRIAAYFHVDPEWLLPGGMRAPKYASATQSARNHAQATSSLVLGKSRKRGYVWLSVYREVPKEVADQIVALLPVEDEAD